MVSELVFRIIKSVETITNDFEIILVNDSSPDNSWKEIEKECYKDSRIKGIDLSRNFGQHYAITAGLSYAQGEWVVVMDCDLQDRPEEIPNLYTKALEGYDSVFAQRKERQDSFLKRTSSKLFYSLFSYLTDTKQDASIANFGIYSKNVIQSILSMGDSIRYFPTMAQWVGFNKYYLPVQHSERSEGGSSYSIKRLLNLAFDNIISFSDKILRLTIQLGITISIISFIIGIYYTISYINGNIAVLGFASIIISLWLIAGILLSVLGVLGIYIGKTFDNTKQRPTFIIKQKIN